MRMYKDTVALEACPAKTAETVSYAATFAVLCWLLFSNYSGLGSAEQLNQPIASTDSPPAGASVPIVSIVNSATSHVEALNETPFTSTIQNQAEAESSNFVTAPPAWPAELDLYQQYASQTHQRAFSTVGWNDQTSDAGQQISRFIEGLALPLPLIDAVDLFDAKGASEIVSNSELTDNALGVTGLIRGITVTGAETERLSYRPGNSHRPQIPRPYRAQEIQRSFVLPPRIQALKP